MERAINRKDNGSAYNLHQEDGGWGTLISM